MQRHPARLVLLTCGIFVQRCDGFDDRLWRVAPSGVMQQEAAVRIGFCCESGVSCELHTKRAHTQRAAPSHEQMCK